MLENKKNLCCDWFVLNFVGWRFLCRYRWLRFFWSTDV